MGIRYYSAFDVADLVRLVATRLDFLYVDCSRVVCFRSRGSKTRHTTARIHGLPKVWQQALNLPPYYVLEVISENYDPLNQDEKDKTVIHELLHIPPSFGGGFRHHKNYVTKKRVDVLHRIFKSEKH